MGRALNYYRIAAVFFLFNWWGSGSNFISIFFKAWNFVNCKERMVPLSCCVAWLNLHKTCKPATDTYFLPLPLQNWNRMSTRGNPEKVGVVMQGAGVRYGHSYKVIKRLTIAKLIKRFSCGATISGYYYIWNFITLCFINNVQSPLMQWVRWVQWLRLLLSSLRTGCVHSFSE